MKAMTRNVSELIFFIFTNGVHLGFLFPRNLKITENYLNVALGVKKYVKVSPKRYR